MSFYIYFTFCLFVGAFQPINCWVQNYYVVTRNALNEVEQTIQHAEKDLLDLIETADPAYRDVSIRVYYESLCRYSIDFETRNFKPVVEKLYQYLDIRTYPYGNAQTYEHNGTYQFRCQHGPRECYGNKLHACALQLIQNKSKALLFNICMMMSRDNSHGSDNAAADACGTQYGVNSRSIIDCANGNRGSRLLKYYGDETKKVHFQQIPYILINGNVTHGDNFLNDVCAAFNNPPPPCQRTST